ncbi:unnamed protein product [Microthlaspi erraticum]|uniref:Mitogen-activated protein kinase n=1 Tax=Microthlaspi erraticum TaxID=1685480 RepID=A0A6D2HUF6_9BRAS|nr:unnamed protein product [Microthlaspi erraticum]
MEPANDAEAVETHGEVTTDVLPNQSPGMLTIENIPAPTHDVRFIQYEIGRHIFELPEKYKPPMTAIGEGAYGFVCSVMNSETGENVAIKKIAHAFDNEDNAKKILREIMILAHLCHENVIEIKDVILPPQRNAFENEVYIAYELMRGDLHQVIRSKGELVEDHYQNLLYQILRGLKYIHSANVIHRDLKPRNLLVDTNCDLKICDFGLARFMPEDHVMSEHVVTRWYRAPELLLKSSSYTTAIDVWSVGCIFLELVNRKPLFPGRDRLHQLRLVMELIGSPSEEDLASFGENDKRCLRELPSFPRQSFSEKFPNVHPLPIDLMEKILKFDPQQRISVEEALAHPYLETMRDINDEPECTTPFNADLEQPLTVEEIKEIIYYLSRI